MGVVYRATDPVLNRTVAIKVMNEGLAHDESLRTRFLHEAQAAGSLQHPNVVTIYDFGETDGHLFIAMEFVEGADLEHLLEHSAPISLAAKLDIIIDVLNGLSYAHRRGIVHRDIKPANIRVNEEGHARIMDFGVARLPTSNLTKTGVMMGTPNYMAPEQITGENVTVSADLFSTGALLFELLTNVKPFQADTMHGVLFKIVTDPVPDVRDIKPDLPIALSGIVQRALAKSPAERFQSASEMGSALSAIRATLGPARVSKTLADRVSHRSAVDKALRDRQAVHDNALADARRWRAVGATAAALLGVAIIGLFVLNGKPTGATGDPAATIVATRTPADSSASRNASPAPPTASPSAQDSAAAASRAADQKPAASPPLASPSPQREAPRRSGTTVPPRDRDRPSPPGRALSDTGTRRAPSGDSTRVGSGAAPASSQASVSSSPPASPPGSVSVPSGGATTAATVPSAPPPAPVPQLKPVEPPENPRPAISAVIAAYARAIGTREISEVRRVYSAMTPQQESAWNSFFGSVRSMVATFEIASLDVNGATAMVRLTGLYEYVSRAGRTTRQPVSVEATLQRESGSERWRLQSVR